MTPYETLTRMESDWHRRCWHSPDWRGLGTFDGWLQRAQPTISDLVDTVAAYLGEGAR